MNNNKRHFIRILSVFFVVFGCAAFAFGAKALNAQEKLEKGQQLYEAGNYEQAMDNFLDVFVEGNTEQINIANEYVNMIHFKRGGVSTPTRVIYDEELEAQKEVYKQEAKDIQKEIEQNYTVAQDSAKEQANVAKEQIDLAKEQANLTEEQTQNYIAETEQDLLALQEQQRAKLLEERAKIDAQLQQMQQENADIQALPGEQFAAAVLPVPENSKQETSAQEEFDKEISAQEELAQENLVQEGLTQQAEPAEDTIVQEEKVYDLNKKDNIIEEEISYMQGFLAAKLNKREGVHVYFRKGKIDAIDIDSDVIFLDDKITFSKEGKSVLEDVYNLMLISKEPTFVLLPPGSYTDEVNLQGVRQIVALNSYLVNMGLSSAKLKFNMGLVNEQPPAKFSNLEGISIVFDYEGKPVLYNKISDKDSYPILSLGMYPEKIDPALNQGMVIDFSVIETSAPINNWKLQIIQHASDGKYYIVRQISGFNRIYDQVFWNGKKQFFGAALPEGVYTLILRAEDKNGREKIVRRKVRIVSQVKEKFVVLKKTQEKTLDYSTPRLWKKPAKILKKKSSAEEISEINEQIDIAETVSSMEDKSQNKVVNPSAVPEKDNLAYDPSLEELL